MNVYLVYNCNNEAYEDYFEYVEAIFSTEEKAIEYITSCGCKPHICVSEFERRYFANRFDSMQDKNGEYYSMWVEEMSVIE